MGLPSAEPLDTTVAPRGHRLLAKVPRLPGLVADRLVEHFGSLQKLSLEQMKRSMPLYLPREATQTRELNGLDLSIEQARQFKFVPPDFRKEQITGHIQMLSGK